MKSIILKFWENWKRIGKKIGEFQSRVVLGLFYFVIVCPFALAIRLACDPLGIKPGRTRGWQPRKRGAEISLENARRQS
jgi:hypothetical protein